MIYSLMIPNTVNLQDLFTNHIGRLHFNSIYRQKGVKWMSKMNAYLFRLVVCSFIGLCLDSVECIYGENVFIFSCCVVAKLNG